uniref:Isochorismatase family protein n=1 Tax=Schlesneria paludicola TaxID=360056 RepID=A0A7C2P3H9_9PLAN
MPAIADAAAVLAAGRFLAEAAQLFGVPVVVTEQYPQGLGHTVAEWQPFCGDVRTKQRFSAVEALGWPAASDPGVERDQVVLAGIEAHVCVAQTAFDLLSLGYRVWVVADARGSRRPSDRDAALARLRDAGVVLTTAEAVAFEWCETAADPKFRAFSALVKQRS